MNLNEKFCPKETKKIIKKDGSLVDFNINKVIKAVNKSAERVVVEFTEDEINAICSEFLKHVDSYDESEIPIKVIHSMVEMSLDVVKPLVGKSYKDYRDYKKNFVDIMDNTYKKSQSIMYVGDRENANTDSALVSTKRSLIFNELNKNLYQSFFLTKEELQACRDGYIYVHDMSARRDTINCCLFNFENVLMGGFEMGNIFYNEPKTLDTAFDVIGDITLMAASQQYGGFTMPELDKILAPFAEKTYQKSLKRFLELGISKENAEKEAYNDVQKEMKQGFQGLEYKFNTVASSRGDYPFISCTIGLGTDKWSKLAAKTCLKVRQEGQGKPGFKKPVLFPKIIFLYDKAIHGEGQVNRDVFDAGIKCSSKAMYPDYLSMSGKGYISEMYQKYGRVISPMGCRAMLSPWFEKGGMEQADKNDKPVFVGRFNVGAVSLHLPMILKKSQEEGKDFYKVLDHYLEMIRRLHIRTYEYLGEMKASNNPLGFCEGGFYGGHLKRDEKIKPILKTATASFGFTALNEMQELYNGKSLVEDGEFAIEVMKYINNKVNDFKNEDGNLYAIYGTPAENLAGVQLNQFKDKYGVIKKVSDKDYVSNSFHCAVYEDISPIEKQDLEYRFWELSNGGKIQYVKYPNHYNIQSIYTLVERAMDMGLYEGVNLSLAYCEDCGHSEPGMTICTHCGSSHLTLVNRICGYLGFSRVHGDTRLNDAKMSEIKDRKSM